MVESGHGISRPAAADHVHYKRLSNMAGSARIVCNAALAVSSGVSNPADSLVYPALGYRLQACLMRVLGSHCCDCQYALDADTMA